MPNLKKMIENGSHTLKARTVLPSSSAVNWASMLMGSGPTMHGYTEWGSKTPEIPSAVLSPYGKYPSVFSLIREQKSSRSEERRVGKECIVSGVRARKITKEKSSN